MTDTASAMVLHRGKILLLHRNNIPTIHAPNTWCNIGGFIEEGETPDRAIRREIQEEINSTVTEIQFLGRRQKRDGGWSYSFITRLSDTQAREVRLGDEGQDLRFFTFDELALLAKTGTLSYHFKDYPDILRHIIETGEAVAPEKLGLQND